MKQITIDFFNSKRCPKCKKELPRSDFYKNKNRKDGFQSWCKTCLASKQSCKKCNKVKDVRAFVEDPYICRTCRNEEEKKQEIQERLEARIKKCTNCEEIQDLSNFYKNKRRRDELGNRCKTCRDKATKEYRKRNPEKHRKRNPEKHRRACRKWQKNNPEYDREWRKRRYKEDPMFRLSRTMSNGIYNSLKGNKKKSSLGIFS